MSTAANEAHGLRRKTTLLMIAVAVVIVLAILAFAIAAIYTRANYVDATHAPEFTGIVGREYTLAIAMPACGVTMDRNYKPPAAEVVISTPPGFGGPEVLWCDDLAAGTAFRVVGVRRCTNCWYEDDRVMVDILPGPGYRGTPASLSGEVLSRDEVGGMRLSFRYYVAR